MTDPFGHQARNHDIPIRHRRQGIAQLSPHGFWFE
jgi:hypothetical protein